MLARRSGAGTGIRARHVPDTSRNGGIDEFAAYVGLRRSVMITEVGNLEGRGAATWICGTGRSPCRARAAGRWSSRSASAPPAAWTGTSASAPGTPGHGAGSCGSGPGNQGPMTASGIYQITVRRGRQCAIEVFLHRFRHHFSHTSLDHGGAEGDLMELNGWTSPRCSAATAPAPVGTTHGGRCPSGRQVLVLRKWSGIWPRRPRVAPEVTTDLNTAVPPHGHPRIRR
jgi:hypothetical protein